jgi:hypothetical protein
VVKHLLNKCKAWSSNPNIIEKREKNAEKNPNKSRCFNNTKCHESDRIYGLIIITMTEL